MEMMNVTDVNVWVVLIGATLAYGWGFVFFSERMAGPAFREIQQTKDDVSMTTPLLLEALSALLLSWLVAIFYMLQIDNGMVLGLGAIFGAFVIVGQFAAAGFAQKPPRLALIGSTYFVGAVIILLATQYTSRAIMM